MLQSPVLTLQQRSKNSGGGYYFQLRRGSLRVRATLGTTNRNVANQLFRNIELAIAQGSESLLWGDLHNSLPLETFDRLASIFPVNLHKSPGWYELESLFRNFLKQRVRLGKLSPNTQARYLITLEKFSAFLAGRKVGYLDGITKPLVEEYKVARLDEICRLKQSRNGGGLALEAAILHRVFAVGIEHDLLVKNPVRMEGRPGERPAGGAEPFTADDLERLRAYAGPDLPAFLLLRWTGFRGSDVVDLRWSDVHFDRQEIERLTQKRKKVVVVPVHPELMAWLHTSVQSSEIAQKCTTDIILLNPVTKRPMARKQLYMRIKALGLRAGVTKAHPHRFRDTLAVDLLARGASPYDVAKVLGDTIETVERHYTPFVRELRERVRGFLTNGGGIESSGNRTNAVPNPPQLLASVEG